MNFNSDNYTVLGMWNKLISLEKWKWSLPDWDKNKHHLSFYNKIVNNIKPKCFANIDYVAEPIRKIFDDDLTIADKLWKLRDEVPSKTGVLLLKNKVHYLYVIENSTELKKGNFLIFTFVKGVFNSFVMGYWLHNNIVGLFMTDNSFDICHGFDNHQIDYSVQMIVTYLLFKEYSEPEIMVVNAKKKQKITFNQQNYLNKEFPFNINIVDSTYFTTIIRDEQFNVKGHFRLQPCGEGMKHRKLIWINGFIKNGYIRYAKCDE